MEKISRRNLFKTGAILGLSAYTKRWAFAQPAAQQAPQKTFQLPADFNRESDESVENLIASFANRDPAISGPNKGEPANPDSAPPEAFLAAFCCYLEKFYNADQVRRVLEPGNRDLGNATDAKLNQTFFQDLVFNTQIEETVQLVQPNGSIEAQTIPVAVDRIPRLRTFAVSKSLQNPDAKTLISGADINLRCVIQDDNGVEVELLRFKLTKDKITLIVAGQQSVEITQGNLEETLQQAKIGLNAYRTIEAMIGGGKLRQEVAFTLWTALQGKNSVFTPSTKKFDDQGPLQLLYRTATDSIIPRYKEGVTGPRVTDGAMSAMFRYRFNKPYIVANIRVLSIGGYFPNSSTIAFSEERKEKINIVRGDLNYGLKSPVAKEQTTQPATNGDRGLTNGNNNTPFTPVP